MIAFALTPIPIFMGTDLSSENPSPPMLSQSWSGQCPCVVYIPGPYAAPPSGPAGRGPGHASAPCHADAAPPSSTHTHTHYTYVYVQIPAHLSSSS